MLEKPKKIKVVAIVSNSRLDKKGQTLLAKIQDHLEAKKIKVIFGRNAAHYGKEKAVTKRDQLLKKADLVVSLGGDGTLLKLARYVDYKVVPILSVNMGTVGFLTEIQKPGRTIKAIDRVLRGEYELDVRSMLRVTIYRQNKKNETFLTLNEMVVNQGNFARLIELSAEINQRKMVSFKGDGVIVSTPTGSTGHSLSARGPIVHPKLDAFIFTPICPATLSICPIVIPSNRQLTLTIETERRYKNNSIALTIDGQQTKQLQYGDKIKIRRSARHFVLVRFSNTRYYKVLRSKLGWGE